ncbi:MAG: amino acid ABC transporter permease [Methylobacteriaceae bacterium]|nr:amino acid ABC transporter permease [Methylobacteriaceae bacterium]
MDLTFSPSFVIPYLPALLRGLYMTLLLSILCISIGLLFGFAVGLMRNGTNRIAYACSTIFVEFFRGTPVLIQLFWIFFCLPVLLNIEIGPFVSATIALSLYMTALASEAFRSALLSIGSEQNDAVLALGLPRRVSLLHVILPQAFLRALPNLLSNSVTLFKESALVSAVGITDLMFQGEIISSATARPIEVLTTVAAMYFAVGFPLTQIVSLVERRVLRRMAI